MATMTNVDLMNLVCRVFAANEGAIKAAIEAGNFETTVDEVIDKAEERRRYLIKQRNRKTETSAQVQRRNLAKTISKQLQDWISPSEIATQFSLKSTNDASGLMRVALKNRYVEEKRNEKGKHPMYRAVAA